MKWQTMSNFPPMMEWENCANTCKHKLPVKARKVFATLLLSLALFTFLIGYKYGYFKWKKSFITWRAVYFNGTWMSSVPLFTQQAHSHSRWGSWMIWGRGEGGEKGGHVDQRRTALFGLDRWISNFPHLKKSFWHLYSKITVYGKRFRGAF